RVVDSEGGVGIGEVQLAIAGVNDAPVAVDDRLSAWSNDGYENVYLAANLLANDVDVDFDPLAITEIGAARFGEVTLAADGSIRYVAPWPDWVGIDSFTYRIADSSGATAEATATLAVKVNTSPDVYPELLFINEDEMVLLGPDELLANDSDIDGDALTIVGVEAGEHCAVDLQPDGRVLFRPELNYNSNYPGKAWFTYTVADGISEPVSTVAFFTIEPVNDRPILTPERISGAVEDNAFQFSIADLLANDSDVEMASPYEEDAIFFAGLGSADHGTIAYDPDSGLIFYQPDTDFFGTETFSYSVIDSFGAASTIESQILVAGVNDLPVVQEDIGSPAEEYIWNYYSIAGLVGNDFDVDGDRLTIHSPHVVQGNAQVTITGGNLAVKPAIGTDRVVIDYTVSDSNGGEVRSTLAIPQILEHNFAPQFTNLYEILLYFNIGGNAPRTDFSFQVCDENGGDNWGQLGDIASISAGRLSTNYPLAQLTELNNTGDFRFGYYSRDLDPAIDYYATFTITAVDHAGATATIFVDYDKLATRQGIYTYQYNPVVLDLDGDGVELVAGGEGALFDWFAGGELEQSGWVGADDGFLVYDYDGNHRVTRADEISLVGYNPEATTDLQGLRAFDTNENGLFDPQDEQWSSFAVWQDQNSNGTTDADELSSLDERGLIAIDLQSDETYQEVAGNYVYGTTTCHLTDGTTLIAADVGLSGGEVSSDPPAEPITEESTEHSPERPVETLAAEEPGREGQTEALAGDETEPAVASEAVDITDQPEMITSADREGALPTAVAEEHLQLSDADLNRLADQLVASIASC
ncbi:MAG: tandem-95 repeat protein, partial [Desulfofustis sp.]|nr:tandem-95 repeat protein [Desulfofustis sp.]